MKVICDALALAEACSNVQRAVSTKASIPAIEGILMKAEDHELTLTGYDLEVGITTSIEARVEQEGSIILNARLLCDILRRLPGESVSVEADERQMTIIHSGEAEYSLIGIAADEYPELPSVTGGYPVTIAEELLKNMIRQTIFVVAVNDSKEVHYGVTFEVENGTIRLIAVDGVRLAVRTEQIDYSGTEISFVVPSKTLSEVTKLLGDEEGVVSMGVGKRHIVFEAGGYHIISRLLDGDFLDYKSAIPSNNATHVRVNTKLFIDSIERTSLLITDRLKSPVRCVFDENTIRISSITSLGSANDKIDAVIDGNRVEIGFNNRFMLEALKVVDTDEVRIELNGAVSPILILPPEGDSFLFLVLPVRLKNEN